MKTSIKPSLAYIFVIGYAVLLPLIYLYLSPVSSGFTGIFLVAVASLLGLKWGILSAFYAIVLSISLRHVTGATFDTILVESVSYLVVAGGIGYMAQQYRSSQEELEKDIARRQAVEEQLRFLSYHDPLTGAHNRTYFEEQVPLLDKNAKLPLSIIMGDVNGLKLINDTFGHHAGDRLLIRAAGLLQQHCRPQDLFCRWGGDEFMLIMPATDKLTALKVTERVNQICKELHTEPISLSIALGVATKEKEFTNVQDVIREAEDRMYRNKLLESKNVRYSLVSSLQSLMEEKTEETIGHALRMQAYALRVGEKLGLSRAELEELALLSALHDIGKIAIPDNIIMKLDALTPTEWELMQKHSEIGHRIAVSSEMLSHIADKILYHHEWWDGTGYPQGLMAEEIPLLARIIAIADSFDVMTHGRPYKVPLTKRQAAQELLRLRGTQYDPRLVDIFLEIVEEEEESGERGAALDPLPAAQSDPDRP